MEMLVVKTNSWYPVLTKMRMKSGVFFNKVQTERNLKVAVINTKAAKTLFGSLNPVGNKIYLEETPFEIIGVSESLNGREEQLFVPEKSLHEIENVPIHQIWCVFSNMAESALMIQKMGLDYSMIKVDELKLVKKVFIQRLCALAIIFVICIIQKLEKSRGIRRKKVWNKLFYVIGGAYMKHAETIKAILLATINEIAADPRKYAVNPGKDFTRNRKLGFHDTIMMLLTMEADCIKEELYRYFGRTPNAPSKTAFYKQRQKLNENALSNLLFAFNSKLAKKLYNGKSTCGFNQVHINAFYSILERRFTNLVIQPGRKRNEYAAFCEMVDAAGNDGPPTVYFADMGYASYNNFAHVIENVQFFTNLPDIEFDFEDFKDLYHMRWDEENSFRDLKYPLCLKVFHSKNFAEAFKICRDFLRIHDGVSTMEVESLIAQNIEPIRPGISFARQHRFKLPISFCYRN